MTRILIVDDNEQNLYMAETLLKANGYEVESAKNGSEALEKARKEPPDLIMSDILMPVMDGFALCREWRLDDRLKMIPFIIYTATYTDAKDEKFARDLGADRFIVKPVSPDLLISIIREVIEKSQTEQTSYTEAPVLEEEIFLKKYNQRLIHKLEDKLTQLEATNRKLEDEIKERKVTETKLYGLERQLIQMQKMEALATLAGGIAHDFNNILMAVMGYAEIALMNCASEKPVRKEIEQVIKGCERAKDLVAQILSFSRQTDMERKPIQINKIVQDLLKLLRSSMPKSINITHKIESNSYVEANPTQIYQVLMNLCTNAGHCMPEGKGNINVSLTDVRVDESSKPLPEQLKPGLYQKLEISDNGIGIKKELLSRIFEPYFTTRKDSGGTGLGLSIVQGIVKECGGVIDVKSEYGKGTVFSIFFPVFTGKASPDSMLEGGSEHILFIDDESTSLEIGVELMQKLGYRVTAFMDSKKALNIFREIPESFDLVISDVIMPDINGINLTGEMHKIRPDTPVILCTGFSDKTTEQKAGDLGVKAFLMKPFVLADLSREIRKALNNTGAPA